MHDLVIRSGRIVDGSGAAAVVGDIAIDGDRITQVGGKAGPGRREIAADGLIVTPGFVDVHTHYDGQATWDPYLAPSGWHGVTTLVMGNCGVGFAPARPDRHEWLIQLMEGVEDIPGSALAEGIKWEWESFPEYLDALEKFPRALDIGTQVPHGAVRGYVMGDRGAANQKASKEDVAAMAAIVEEALRAGALGFTSSRTMLHRAKDGRPVPGTFAGHDELMGIGRACARAGHGVFEIASDFAIGGMHGRFHEDIAWMRDLSKETGLPVSFIVAQASHNPGEWREILQLTETAVGSGANLRMQVAVRPAGMLLSFDNPMHPFKGHPTYLKVAHLPFAERIQILSTPEMRAQLAAEQSALSGKFDSLFVTHFDGVMPPTLIASDRARIVEFRAKHKEIILKPLYGNGGAGVFHLKPGDDNLNALLEMFTARSREPIMVQKYLPAVRKGDKRIILIDGEPGGAVSRIPAAGEARANLHVGGRAAKTKLTPRDRELCAAIGPTLKAKGLVFVGIDVIGDYLTEINVTSPTGIQEINRLDGVKLERDLWDAIEARLKARRGPAKRTA